MNAAVKPVEEPATVQSLLDTAAQAIEDARLLNQKQQNGLQVGTPAWHLCALIDDKLFNALVALGG